MKKTPKENELAEYAASGDAARFLVALKKEASKEPSELETVSESSMRKTLDVIFGLLEQRRSLPLHYNASHLLHAEMTEEINKEITELGCYLIRVLNAQ